MTAPQNRPYRRRFANPAARWLSNGAMDRFDARVREPVEEMVVWLDGQDVVDEATRVAQLEAERRERFERMDSTTGEIRRGDPGE